MWQTLKNAWAIEDIRKKILYTLFILLLYRLGSFVPVAGVNVTFIRAATANYDILGLMNMLTGGSFGNYTIFAMGISPYITSSIIIQLLTVAIPKLEAMQKEGDEGRKKLAQYTRYATVILAFIQAVGIILGLGYDAILHDPIIPDWITYITIGLTLMAGSALVMWMGERITENGIGNGISLLIFAGIVAQLPANAYSMLLNTFEGLIGFWVLPVVLLGALVIIAGITFIDMGERRVPVQYAKRVTGRRTYGGQSTHIPMKVNASGVMPLIFAMSMISFPQVIMQFWPDSAFYAWYIKWLGSGTVVHTIIYMLLIVGFSFFYSAISFNPIEVSKNIQEYGGFIPGIRPGRPTSDYFSRISKRLVLVSAVFLGLVAAVPQVFSSFTGMNSPFGPTSLLIMVSVALETTKQLEAQMMMRHYKGFLN